MSSKPRLRFGLRALLLLPVLAAAFFAGWQSNEYLTHREFRRQQAEADERRAKLLAQIESERHRRVDLMQMMIDRVEQNQRMRLYRSLKDNPTKGRMMPPGRF